MTTLTERLLALPNAPLIPSPRPSEFTRQLDVGGDKAVADIKTVQDATREEITGTALKMLEANNLDPAEWAVTGFRASEWTMANGGTGTSARVSFGRRGSSAVPAERPPLDEILAQIKTQGSRVTFPLPEGEHAYIVALGDMQFGKVDGDGVEGTLKRAIEYIDQAAQLLKFYRQRFDVGHIHVAWLGDHIEGFQSQGGANVWRTQLTLSEQIRLTRAVMTHALLTFAPLAEKVTMVAVPGNHGETTRFAGKGVTRYDDSHDTDALIAVQEAAAMSERFGHVEFYAPGTDELTVTLDLAGTITGHAHGHQFRPGQHFKWWGEQAFGESPLAGATLLLLGHLHHELIEGNGKRLVLQVPALESESTWYRHARGVNGNPGIVVAITKNGVTGPIEVIR